MKVISMRFAGLLILLLVLSAAMAIAGGENRAGTNAAPELLIPVGARDIAMGGASIATTSGVDAIYWNPAGLAHTSYNASALFSHMTYIADISVNYFAVGATFGGFGTLGFSLKSLAIGDIPVTTNDFPDGTGEIINPTYVTLGATYSRMLAENISVGFTTNLISEQIGRVGATGLGFDAGVQYANLGGIEGWSLGVAVKNIGPQMRFDGDALLQAGSLGTGGRQGYYKIQAGSYELPSTIEIASAYTASFSGNNAVTLVGCFQNNNFDVDEYKVGGEYGYNNMFFVRGGWSFAESRTNDNLTTTGGVDKTTYLFGPTAGVGVHTNLGDVDVSIDYAYRSVQFLDGNNVFALRLGF